MSPNIIKRTNPPSIHPPFPGYNHVSSIDATKPHRLITISGQIGVDKTGKPAGTYAEQVHLAFDNLKACLEAAGATPADVVKLNWYIVDFDAAKEAVLGQALVEFYGKADFGCATLLGVAKLANPALLFEMDATAAVPVSSGDHVVNNPIKTGADIVDVVVVGAGLSGLKAACDIQAAGLSCTVLEANDRVGGKTLTVRSAESNTGFNDVGAAWINTTNQSHMYALAQKLGLTGKVQRAEGKSLNQRPDGTVLSFPYGEPSQASEEDTGALLNFFALITKLIDESNLENPSTGPGAIELDSLTLAQFVEKNAGANSAVADRVNKAARGLLGVEADEISALFFVNYCKSGTGIGNLLSDLKDGGQHLRIREGVQNFSTALAKELKPSSVVLSTPVSSIEQLQSGYCIVRSSAGGAFRCRRVIVSVPTSLYPSIKFSPALSPAKQVLGESTVLGYYSKMILVFEKPWWREANLSGTFDSSTGPVAFTRDTSVEEDNQWSITCFIVGEPGRKWSSQSKAARRKQVLDQFNAVFGSAVGNIPEPVNIIEMEWAKQPHFGGAPCPVMAPGILTSVGKAIREPCGKIHFVGTETSLVWKGYMEGAIRSGIRGAGEVIEALRKEKVRSIL